MVLFFCSFAEFTLILSLFVTEMWEFCNLSTGTLDAWIWAYPLLSKFLACLAAHILISEILLAALTEVWGLGFLYKMCLFAMWAWTGFPQSSVQVILLTQSSVWNYLILLGNKCDKCFVCVFHVCTHCIHYLFTMWPSLNNYKIAFHSLKQCIIIKCILVCLLSAFIGF